MAKPATQRVLEKLAAGWQLYVIEGYGYRLGPPESVRPWEPESVRPDTVRRLIRARKIRPARSLKGRAQRFKLV